TKVESGISVQVLDHGAGAPREKQTGRGIQQFETLSEFHAGVDHAFRNQKRSPATAERYYVDVLAFCQIRCTDRSQSDTVGMTEVQVNYGVGDRLTSGEREGHRRAHRFLS